jgi:hypothetical protein
MTLGNDIYFFFIDDQGSINNNQEWLLLGGLLINVQDYHNLSRDIKSYCSNIPFINNAKELKWSDLSAAMYLKRKEQPFKPNKPYSYLSNVEIREIENFIKNYFQLVNRYNYQIILSVSNKQYFENKLSKSFIKLQIEDLLQRVQYEIQSSGSLAIFTHDSRPNKEENNTVKSIYKEILSSSKFVTDFKNIIDNLFIEDSHLNSGIQISDFIIGVISGCLRGYNFSKNLYQNYLKQKLRKSPTGNVIGFGILPTGLTQNDEYKHILKTSLDVN